MNQQFLCIYCDRNELECIGQCADPPSAFPHHFVPDTIPDGCEECGDDLDPTHYTIGNDGYYYCTPGCAEDGERRGLNKEEAI